MCEEIPNVTVRVFFIKNLLNFISINETIKNVFFYKFEYSYTIMTKNIRIHLADDHQIIIHGIQTLLNTVPNFQVVGFSLNGTTVFEDVTNNKADVLVLDISMPEKDGIE